MKTIILSAMLFLLCIFFSLYTSAQAYEYGDAPENALAYPSTGVNGQFPTCSNVGVNYVRHSNFGAVLGPAFDLEGDGNAGLCPGFSPYDSDECFNDGDAGLLFPEPYTIVNNAVVTCPNSIGTSLGATCTLATWGGNVDISIANNMPPETPGYMNVVFDFSQNGVWGDLVSCPAGMMPEHVVQNFYIPWGYVGPLSGLGPPGFTIGPNTGYVWARFTISESPVAINWDGSGFFEDGESEDYLIYIGDPPAQSDFGDAPDDVLAYPSTGTMGLFPTCMGTGTGHIEHMHSGAELGPSVDYEIDGNAGLCPSFAPYDDDECFNGGDAGLLFPEPYTIIGGNVATCPNSNGTPLGFPCDTAVWGSNIDIDVHNNMPTGADGLMNVLIDWNKNGVWGDIVFCDTIPVPEHVLQNFAIPHGHTGTLSSLLPPDFIIGPEEGFFWARFTISDMAINVPWDGSGFFNDGETEDYLLHVDTAGVVYEVEYGDAPEGSIGYPSTGVMGNFPTCIFSGPTNHYVSHLMGEGIFFGPLKDMETDGNAGICSPYNYPYDNDECFQDNDAGLILPAPYTIVYTGGAPSVVPCTGMGGMLDSTCNIVNWGAELDINVTNMDTIEALVNVLMDFNQNGCWDFDTTMQCSGVTIHEHVLVNFPVPSGYSGPLSVLNPPSFMVGPNVGYLWTRFTVSEQSVVMDWDGVGFFDRGESEDYLLYVDLFEGLGEYNMPKDINLQIFPNPTSSGCTISYTLSVSAKVSIDVYNINGSLIRKIGDANQFAGSQTVKWDGLNTNGQAVNSGIYIIKVSLNSNVVERAKLLIE